MDLYIYIYLYLHIILFGCSLLEHTRGIKKVTLIVRFVRYNDNILNYHIFYVTHITHVPPTFPHLMHVRDDLQYRLALLEI